MRRTQLWNIRASLLGCLATLLASQAQAGSYHYITLTVNGEKSSSATAINMADQAVGYVADIKYQVHGLVWAKGVLTQVDATGGFFTEFAGVNARGLAVGDYFQAGLSGRIAFTYDIATGQQQRVTRVANDGFYPSAIDRMGTVIGQAETQGGLFRGFMARGTKTTLMTAFGSPETFPAAINDSREIVGAYKNHSGIIHGFMFHSGVYTTFDPPASVETGPSFVAADGTIAGSFLDSAGSRYGFISTGGLYATVDYPGAVSTFVAGIGSGGEVMGNWTDTNGRDHGFIEQGGHFASVDFPGGTQTRINGTNLKGSLAGYYLNSRGKMRGFVAICPKIEAPCTP